jgi:FlaA1/EpsC-like NDP-sugar epimerase
LLYANEFCGLYKFEHHAAVCIVDKIVIVFATTFCFLLAAAFALKISTEYSRIWTASFAFASLIGTLLFRVIAAQIIGRLSDRQVFSRNVVIVGSGEQMARLLDKLDKSQSRFITVLGVFVERQEDVVANDVSRYAMLGTVDDLPSFIRGNNVDDVVISLPWSADGQITQMLDSLRELPVNAYLGSDLDRILFANSSSSRSFRRLAAGRSDGQTLGRLGWHSESCAGLRSRVDFNDYAAPNDDFDRDGDQAREQRAGPVPPATLWFHQ